MRGRTTLGREATPDKDDVIVNRTPWAATAVLHVGRTTGEQMAETTHTRLAFQFDGELDDVPADAAAALARMARALLQHSDEHDGRSAMMRLERLGPLLNLWLTDPECSPACLCRSGHLSSTADPPGPPAGDVSLALDPGPDDGLRLHWALVLADETQAGPSTLSQPRLPTDAP